MRIFRLFAGVSCLAMGIGAKAADARQHQAKAATEPKQSLPADRAASAPTPVTREGGDIVITARRRDESSISVPVSVTAFNAAQLERMNVTTLADLASTAPGLRVGEVSGGVGGTIVLRGVGTTAGSNASFEQTVSVNLDGVGISRGSAIRLGQIDMQSIEILKGPQALFFGKNSPAGVISITTADPGNRLEVLVRGGYELDADEKRGDLVISTPLTSTVGARLALSISDMEGYRTNLAGFAAATANALRPGAVSGFEPRGPKQTFLFGRGTLRWQPGSRFDARAKFTYSKLSGIGYQQGGGFQRIYCPNGVAFQANQAAALSGGVQNPALAAALAVDDCRADDRYANGQINPAFLVGAPRGVTDPAGAGEYLQVVGSLQMNYRPSAVITVTSVSGYVKSEEFRYDTYGNSPSDAVAALDFLGRTNYTQKSQEIRVSSDLPGALNFLVGGYLEDSLLNTYIQSFASGGGALFDQFIDGRTYSAFAQGMFDITPRLELAGGARFTREQRDYSVVRNGVPQPLRVDKVEFDNVSPELTLTFRPTRRLTVYGAFKTGFKSGGFATPFTGGAALVAPGPDNSYRPEKARGFEAGVKALLFGGALRVNTAAYYVDYTDLQVNSLDNSTGAPVIRVTNAAAAKVKGIEGDFVFRPGSAPGLILRGAINYNYANYTDFLATCYIGQTIAMGCNLNPGPTGNFRGQQLAGRPLVNAPRWNGALGFTYDRDLSASGVALGLSGEAVHKGSYNPHPELAPGAEQRSVWFLNGSIRLYQEASGWDVAIIGRNLTNRFRADVASNAGQTGIAARTGTSITGGLADLNGNVNRGREILLQLTVRPNRLFE